ncbi:bifunctional 4-hydroxy-2-oxoglutarate aldolase/2-dehydro-3-deoxy-phosphogluconate aldolase [Kutzneria sp. NPDC051319]|uniref:bifunctional 4-hydroxy-2-oxoglutarate aldolase/2-dehydro-3-deoxy-phosphogluconate aldolase n=1 Tax=Kutzneria sp. NPDC051319 TaxID=3155047 RepID=UPI003417A798
MTFGSVLRSTRLVGIVRGDGVGNTREAVRVLFESGVRLVEVSLTGPGALEAISSIQAPEGCWLGAGTVRTAADASAAIAAGATFAVSPALTASVAACVGAGLPILAGALTPTEVESAVAAGAEAVKLFPASFGGPGYLSALRQPFPTVPFVPVGGVGVAEAEAYLAAGAIAVGVGSPLVGDAATGGDLSALAERAARFVKLAS